MPTSLILDTKFKLPKSCNLNDEKGMTQYHDATYQLYCHLKTSIFDDYVIDNKHYSIKIVTPTDNQDFDTNVDNLPSFTHAFTNAVSRRLYNRPSTFETFEFSDKTYVRNVIFVNKDNDRDIVLFDLVELNFKCNFNYVETTKLFDIEGSVEILTDEDELRHDFKNGIWEMLKYFVTRTIPKQNGNIRNILF